MIALSDLVIVGGRFRARDVVMDEHGRRLHSQLRDLTPYEAAELWMALQDLKTRCEEDS